jgi:hypothetical protein
MERHQISSLVTYVPVSIDTINTTSEATHTKKTEILRLVVVCVVAVGDVVVDVDESHKDKHVVCHSPETLRRERRRQRASQSRRAHCRASTTTTTTTMTKHCIDDHRHCCWSNLSRQTIVETLTRACRCVAARFLVSTTTTTCIDLKICHSVMLVRVIVSRVEAHLAESTPTKVLPLV